MKDLILLCSLIIIVIINIVISSDISQQSVVHRSAENGETGVWKKRIEWKASWVKDWEERKIIVPIWRKIWGPIEINEWLPLPKMPKWKS